MNPKPLPRRYIIMVGLAMAIFVLWFAANNWGTSPVLAFR